MEIVGDIVIVILLIIIGYYQNHKIGSLEAQIKSQKGILESADAFFKLFDLEKLKGYGEILIEKTRGEMEIEIKKIKTDLDETIAKHKNEKQKLEFVGGEFAILMRSFMDAVFLLPKNFRKEIIDHMGEGAVRQGMKKLLDGIEEREEEARREAFSRAWYGKDKGKALKKGQS